MMGHSPPRYLLVKRTLTHQGSCQRSTVTSSRKASLLHIIPRPQVWSSPASPNVLCVHLSSPPGRGAVQPAGSMCLLLPQLQSEHRAWRQAGATSQFSCVGDGPAQRKGSECKGASPSRPSVRAQALPRCHRGGRRENPRKRFWPGSSYLDRWRGEGLALASEGDAPARKGGRRKKC